MESHAAFDPTFINRKSQNSKGKSQNGEQQKNKPVSNADFFLFKRADTWVCPYKPGFSGLSSTVRAKDILPLQFNNLQILAFSYQTVTET